MNNDVYIFERKFFNDVVLVAINKNDTTGYSVSGLNTALPSGNYTDYLGGLMSGPGITVTTGSGGNNPVTELHDAGALGSGLAIQQHRERPRSWFDRPDARTGWS